MVPGRGGTVLTAFILLAANLALLILVARRQHRLFLASQADLRDTLDDWPPQRVGVQRDRRAALACDTRQTVDGQRSAVSGQRSAVDD
jgi:hypothetical protein